MQRYKYHQKFLKLLNKIKLEKTQKSRKYFLDLVFPQYVVKLKFNGTLEVIYKIPHFYGF